MKKARLLTFIKVSRTCPTKNTKDCKVLILLLFLISDGAEGETLQIVRGNSRIFSKRFIYHALRMIQRIFLLA